MQNLLYSIRAIKPGNPPFTFDNLPKGFDRGVWTNGEGANPQPTGAKIHFIASKDFENVDFFQNITAYDSDYDFSNLQVYINGELTDQIANNISAKADDDIIIKATDDHYPWFSSNGIDYIKSIKESFPLMHQASGETITDFSYCFYNCTSLTSIPAGLFDNNPQVTDFTSCFFGCSSLTSIPAGLFDNNTLVTDFTSCFNGCSNLVVIPISLFDNNPQVTRFTSCFGDCSSITNIPAGLFDNNTLVTNISGCFYNCSSLTSIPAGLFYNNPQVTDFTRCFYYCTSLAVNVQIGSNASSVAVTFFARNTKEKGTVYCREGSAAYQAFLEDDTANVNVLTY